MADLMVLFLHLRMSSHCVKISKACRLNLLMQAGESLEKAGESRKQNYFRTMEGMGHKPRKGSHLSLNPR